MEFDQQQMLDMAQIFKAMGEPSRLALIRQLMQTDQLSVGQLAENTRLTQANVSKHLKTLAQTGLVAANKDKNFVRYHIAHPLVKEICTLCCDHLVSGLPSPKPHFK